MDSLQITEKAQDFAESILMQLSEEFTYHNLNHTQEAVAATIEIGIGSGLSEGDIEIVTIAAWFHDTGFTKQYHLHEEASALYAERFLKEENYPKEKIKAVLDCIKATEMRNPPENLIEKVMCDADLAHLGEVLFRNRSENLRKEWNVLLKKEPTDIEWYSTTLSFLEAHKFYTSYARKHFLPGKEKNIQIIRDIVEKLNNGIPLKALETKNMTEDQGKKKKKKIKEPKYGRGVETMFRTAMKNHMQLSALADSKANLMLSINAIVISIILSILVPRFDGEGAYIILPTTVLLAVCVLTVIFATISTIPKVTTGTFSKEDIATKRANLLFFGNFHNMGLDDYETGMWEMIKDQNFLYGALTRDLYFLGKVLHKKYKFLRWCYNVFMYGLIISVVTFLICYTVHFQN